jgi:hypothetical protein
MSADRSAKFVSWKSRTKYTVKPVKMRKSGGRDHTGGKRAWSIQEESVLGSWGFFFLFVFCFVLFFETGFLCVALAVLELTL